MKEFRYTLHFRPFSSEAYPTEGIVRVDPPIGDAKFGVAVYDRPVDAFVEYEMMRLVDDSHSDWVDYVADSLGGMDEDEIEEERHFRQCVGHQLDRAGAYVVDLGAFAADVRNALRIKPE